MAVKVWRSHNSESHQDRIVLVDHFGHEFEMTVHTVYIEQKKDADGKLIPGEYVNIQTDVDTLIEQHSEMHRAREMAHLEYMLTHYPDDPATLAHPDNPINAEKPPQMFEFPRPKNCKDCK